MYRIYLDGELFYDPRLPEYALTGIKCDLEVNKTGTLRFTIPATHPLIGSVQKMYSELTLYQDKDWLYSGRVLSDDTDFDGNRTIECHRRRSAHSMISERWISEPLLSLRLSVFRRLTSF